MAVDIAKEKGYSDVVNVLEKAETSGKSQNFSIKLQDVQFCSFSLID